MYNNIVNLSFPVIGESLPADHNYQLYAALSKQIPQIHQLEGLAINTIPGIPDKKGKIALTRNSRLLIKLPVEAVARVYILAGQVLNVGGHSIQVGNPELQTLQPTDSLKARLVAIKGYTEPQSFLEAAQRQLQALNVNGNIGIPANEEGEPKRLTLKIKNYHVVGFSVVVNQLSPNDSLKLQVYGLGGKQRLGCGFFHPVLPVARSGGETREKEETFS
jgi:CRISPR-associated protein Cas6